DFNDIVGRNQNVIAGIALPQSRQHGLVTLVDVVDDGDATQLFKIADRVLGHIGRPVENAQRLALEPLRACPGLQIGVRYVEWSFSRILRQRRHHGQQTQQQNKPGFSHFSLQQQLNRHRSIIAPRAGARPTHTPNPIPQPALRAGDFGKRWFFQKPSFTRYAMSITNASHCAPESAWKCRSAPSKPPESAWKWR